MPVQFMLKGVDGNLKVNALAVASKPEIFRKGESRIRIRQPADVANKFTVKI